jgi:HEPN domain-containing protein
MGASSPGPEQREYAQVLLHRAESDLRACRALAKDPTMEDDVVGFHAQQAVEKSLKVALLLAAVPFPRTHDLDFLLARAEGHGVEVPAQIEESDWLSPWAAQLRYDEVAAGLDREKALEVADAAVAWARTLLPPPHLAGR